MKVLTLVDSLPHIINAILVYGDTNTTLAGTLVKK